MSRERFTDNLIRKRRGRRLRWAPLQRMRNENAPDRIGGIFIFGDASSPETKSCYHVSERCHAKNQMR
jgi:hypothetical protein